MFIHVSHDKEGRKSEKILNGFDLNNFWCLSFSFVFWKKYISKVPIATILNYYSVLSRNLIHLVEKIRAPQKSLRGCEAAALRCYCMCFFFFTCLEAVGTNSLNNQSRTYELRAVVRFSNRGDRELFITVANSKIPSGLKSLLLYLLGSCWYEQPQQPKLNVGTQGRR